MSVCVDQCIRSRGSDKFPFLEAPGCHHNTAPVLPFPTFFLFFFFYPLPPPSCLPFYVEDASLRQPGDVCVIKATDTAMG